MSNIATRLGTDLAKTAKLNQPSISLFSNCGAGDYGYAKAGFDFVVLAELNPKRLKVAELNHPNATTVVGDLNITWETVVDSYSSMLGKTRPSLLSACPPCQGLSSANSKRGRESDSESGGRDPRNLLVLPIVEVAKNLWPRAIVVENVPAFLTRKVPHPQTGEGISAACLLASLLMEYYVLFPFLCDLADYGIPQHRKRSFLTFVKRDEIGLDSIIQRRLSPYPRPTNNPIEGGETPVAVGEFLRSLNLPKLDARDAETARSKNPLHRVPVWSEHHYAMVDAIPVGRGMSAWENQSCRKCGIVEVDLNAASCPTCCGPLLRPVIQESDGNYRLIRGFRSSSYRRMDPDRPAPAVTTANGTIGSSTTIHPYENRVLSVLECCHLQTIPSDYRWTNDCDEPIELHVIRRMVGEAVPPRFTELHGRAIQSVLSDDWCMSPISVFDDRCLKAANLMGLPRFER